jgi:nucleoside 2-deoxyribosyltransferase
MIDGSVIFDKLYGYISPDEDSPISFVYEINIAFVGEADGLIINLNGVDQSRTVFDMYDIAAEGHITAIQLNFKLYASAFCQLLNMQNNTPN